MVDISRSLLYFINLKSRLIKLCLRVYFPLKPFLSLLTSQTHPCNILHCSTMLFPLSVYFLPRCWLLSAEGARRQEVGASQTPTFTERDLLKCAHITLEHYSYLLYVSGVCRRSILPSNSCYYISYFNRNNT